MHSEPIEFRGPAAYVSDLDRARQFYEGVLGLEVSRLMKRDGRLIAVAYTAGLSVWEAADAFFSIFGAPDPAWRGPERPDWENAFEVGDVDAIYARAVAAGARLAHPLRELPWGQRTFRMYDPDGHVIDVGETHAATARRMVASGMPREQVAEKLGFPAETVDRFVS
jgi:catechol 2,3-dioxygenase-like lactoylglutathione lyase family enzyme